MTLAAPDNPPSRASSLSPPVPAWQPMALLMVTALLAYLPALSAGFIWDDPDYVINNSNLRDWAGLVRTWTVPTSLPQWYPLTHTTFWVEYQLFGLNPLPYHLTNILLHGLGAYLLYRLLRRLDLSAGVPLLGAMLWSLHPVQVESVAWVTERKNTLSFCLYATSFWCLLNWQEQQNQKTRWGNYLAALACFTLALASKTVTATLPAAFLLVCFYRSGKFPWRTLWQLTPFFAIGFAAGQLTAHLERTHVGAAGPEWAFTPVERTLIAGRAAVFYLTKLAAPFNLAFIYPRWTLDASDLIQYLYPAAVVIGLMGLYLLRNRIGRGPFVAISFFIGTLTPALGFFNVYPHRYSFVADHFQHLASVGPLVLVAAFLVRLPRLLPVGIVLFLSLLTFHQTRIYKDPLTLWTDTAKKNPDSWMVHLNLGLAHHELAQRTSDPTLRREHERARFESMLKARELGPHLPETHWNAGLALERGGGIGISPNPEAARAAYRRAIELDDTFVRAHISLVRLMLATPDYPPLPPDLQLPTTYSPPATLPEALAFARHAVALQPKFPLAQATLAQLLLYQTPRTPDLLEQSARHYAAALSIDPNHPDWRIQLARVVTQLALTHPDPAQKIPLLQAALGHYQLALRLSLPPARELQNEIQSVMTRLRQ